MIEIIMGLALTQTLILTFLIIWNEFDQQGLTNADNYSIMKSMRKNKNMIKMINIWAYNGTIPRDISPYRWNAICKFIQKNFDDLRIAP